MIRVALDAMGGDHAPQAEIEGALAGARDAAGRLHDPAGRARATSSRRSWRGIPASTGAASRCVEAPEVIGMAEKPLAAVRKKPKSSLVDRPRPAEGRRSPTRSSPPATPAPRWPPPRSLLGLHDGVERATVGHAVPDRPTSRCWCSTAAPTSTAPPRELVGFAHLGTVYARDVLGRPSPVVGLLNVGEEDEKGNAVVKEAHQLLKTDAGLNYVGNIEGRDILAGPRQARPHRRGGVRRLRRQRRAQVLRVGRRG